MLSILFLESDFSITILPGRITVEICQKSDHCLEIISLKIPPLACIYIYADVRSGVVERFEIRKRAGR